MVIEFVGHRGVGNRPVKRLETVLSDIKFQSGSQKGESKLYDGRDQVDRLYARIVFEAFRLANPDDREIAKRVLAAVVLAKEPLRISDLVEFLSANASESTGIDIVASIESTLWELSPIIPVADDATTSYESATRQFTDFFLSHDRSAAALSIVVKNWTSQMPDDPVADPLSFILDCEKGKQKSCSRMPTPGQSQFNVGYRQHRQASRAVE